MEKQMSTTSNEINILKEKLHYKELRSKSLEEYANYIEKIKMTDLGDIQNIHNFSNGSNSLENLEKHTSS